VSYKQIENKMECKSLHKKIIFFLEGELSAEEMEQMKLHLSECGDCAAFAREMEKTFAILQSEKSPAINPFFYTRLKAKMENQAAEQNVIFRNPVWARILQPAFFSVLLLAGIYMGIKIGQPTVNKMNVPGYSEQEMIPYLNEMESETIEGFLLQ